MRFSALTSAKAKANGGLLKIPNAEFIKLIDDWTKDMASRRYQKRTRVEHWQEAIDCVYTAIEKELQSVNTNTIMAHKKWEAMLLAAHKNFPEHINIYHPTPVEQQRVARLVKATRIRRILKDKLELINILKEDKELGSKTLTELTVSRLQCEVLAASAQIVFSRHKAAPAIYHDKTDVSSGSSSAPLSKEIYGSASYDSGNKPLKWGLEHKLKTSAKAKSQFSAESGAERSSLMASANAGLDASSQVTADFDYEISKSCTVKTEYLRRIMGDKFNLIQGRLGGSAQAVASISARAGASAEGKSPEYDTKNDFSSGRAFGVKTAGDVVGAEVKLAGEVEISVKLSGRAGVKLMQTVDLEVTGDLKAGVDAGSRLNVFINGQGVGLDVGVSALAGFKVGSNQTFTLTHPSRNISVFSLKMNESFSAGIGAEASLKGVASVDEVSFGTSAGITVLAGAGGGVESTLSPRGALLVGYDLIAVPALLNLRTLMNRHDPAHASIHTRRINAVCEYLNKKASKGEINQVYLDCTTRVTSMIGALNQEMDALHDPSRKLRTPGFAGYTQNSLTDIKPVTSAYYEQGVTKRKTPLQIVFGSEAETGDQNITLINPAKGQLGETITQDSLQVDQDRVRTKAVNPAKENLNTLVTDYEKAKIHGSGERLAFDVICRDLLDKTIDYI